MAAWRLACLAVAAAASAALLAGCGRQEAGTHVLGSSPGPDPAAGLIDVQGRKVSPPPTPRGAMAQLALAGPNTTLALWEEQGHVVASRHHPARGWDAPQPLEAIAGEASDPRLAANGRGAAIAVWRHSVGRIDSLRYSRWDARSGWSEPDVIPGALPRPRQPGKTAGRGVAEAAPRIEIDAHGNVRAEWLSGFNEGEAQVSTFVPGEGWSRPLDQPLQAAAAASQPAAAR